MSEQLENLFTYTKLKLLKNLNDTTPPLVESHVPIPTDDDYTIGYINRSFIQKRIKISWHSICRNDWIRSIDFEFLSKKRGI